MEITLHTIQHQMLQSNEHTLMQIGLKHETVSGNIYFEGVEEEKFNNGVGGGDNDGNGVGGNEMDGDCATDTHLLLFDNQDELGDDPSTLSSTLS